MVKRANTFIVLIDETTGNPHTLKSGESAEVGKGI